MNRSALVLTILVAASMLRAQQDASAADWSGHASYVFGYKRLESRWAPVRDQFEFGVLDLDLRPPDWPVHLCGKLMLSYADAPPDIEGSRGDYCGTWEIDLGLRKLFDLAPDLDLFVSGGGGLMGASVSSWVDFGGQSAQVYEDSQTTFGLWASAGLYWNCGESWHLGFEVEYSHAELDLFEATVDAGGLSLRCMIGTHW